MTGLGLTLTLLSLLVLGAHFLRAGQTGLVAAALALAALAFLRRPWVRRGLQVALLAAAVIWARGSPSWRGCGCAPGSRWPGLSSSSAP